MFMSQKLHAQVPNTFMYEHDPNLWYQASDATVMEKFAPTNNFVEGTIIFQPLHNGTDHNLQVTLIDGFGNIQRNDLYEYFGKDLIPNAAAYNPNIQTYVVTGTCTGFTNVGAYNSWYMLFDQDLNLLNANYFDLLSSNSLPIIFGAGAGTFVTDVCPVINPLSGPHFAFTGLLLEGGDNPNPRPDINNNQPTNRVMFIATLDAVNAVILDKHEYYFDQSGANATQFSYPSRITEINNTGFNAINGFLVAGTTSNVGVTDASRFFYLRTAINLQIYAHKVIDDNTPFVDDNIFAVGDLYNTGPSTDEIHVAGTITALNGTHSYFFDKLWNLNSPVSVLSYLENWPPAVPANVQMGIFRLNNQRLGGYPKVGRVTTPFSDISVITGSFCRNLFYQFNNFYSTLLPNTFEVNYTNNALNNWLNPLNQNTSFDLYPRLYGVLGPVPYYLAHSFESPWYPNHKSFLYNFNDRLFLLGGLGLDNNNAGDYVVANLADRPGTNACLMDNDLATADFFPVSVAQFNAIYDAIMGSVESPIAITQPAITLPVFDDCLNGAFLFKNTETESGVKNDKHYQLEIGNEQLLFNCFSGAYDLTVYNSIGEKLISYQTKGKSEIDLSHLPSGLYFLRILQSNGKPTESIKFIHK